MSGGARRALAVALGLGALVAARPARAHTVGLSNGDYRVTGATLSVDLGMAERELATFVPELDRDHDGQLDADEVTAGGAALTRAVVDGIRAEADGVACPGALVRAWPLEGEAGVVVQARYTCPHEPSRLTISWPMLRGLAAGHRHVAHFAFRGKIETTVLDATHATWTLGASAAGLAWSMVKLGVEHILTGYDHLVFLVGLILVGGTLRSLVGVITAFTVAHSITLALAALGVFAPSPRLVEPAIALSIAYVGVENLFVEDASRRWRITFPFGLIHGFGFASALRAIALPHAQIPVALVSFNVGVEIGQLGVLAIALPLTTAARRSPMFGARGVKLASVAIAVAGLVLFVARLVSKS
ncbi:MAG TPA: HupE/UreJ family protein [Polyangia bacterium]|nr:HupE/UreJ family protein [Polyangia bacterium]